MKTGDFVYWNLDGNDYAAEISNILPDNQYEIHMFLGTKEVYKIVSGDELRLQEE